MTSVLNVDSIAAKDGTSPVTLTNQYAIKIWINFNGSGTIAIMLIVHQAWLILHTTIRLAVHLQ